MSSRSHRPFYGLSARGGLTILFALWMIAELVAFVLVVRAVGVGGALAIGVLATCAGAILLRRLSRTAVTQVRAAVRNGRLPLGGAGVTDGLLQALAAILLILPGFISGLVGAALSFAPLRRIVQTYIRRTRRPGIGDVPRDPRIVDLRPEDWRVDGRA